MVSAVTADSLRDLPSSARVPARLWTGKSCILLHSNNTKYSRKRLICGGGGILGDEADVSQNAGSEAIFFWKVNAYFYCVIYLELKDLRVDDRVGVLIAKLARARIKCV